MKERSHLTNTAEHFDSVIEELTQQVTLTQQEREMYGDLWIQERQLDEKSIKMQEWEQKIQASITNPMQNEKHMRLKSLDPNLIEDNETYLAQGVGESVHHSVQQLKALSSALPSRGAAVERQLQMMRKVLTAEASIVA